MGKHLITGSSYGFSSFLKIIEEAYAVRLSVVAVVRMPFANLRIPSNPALPRRIPCDSGPLSVFAILLWSYESEVGGINA